MAINLGNPVNWQNPLNRGLKAWHLPRSPELYRRELANSNGVATISGTTWAALSPHNNAGSVNSDGSSRFLSIPAAWLTGATNASYGAWVYRSWEGNSVNIGSAAAAAAFGFIWFIDANVYSDVGSQYAYCALAGTGWHHIVIAYDGSGATNPDRLKIYIDGANQTLTFSGTLASSLGTITAMHLFRDQPTRYGTGNITDFRLFNRTLTAQQVRDWYRSSSSAALPQLNYIDGSFIPTVSGSTFTATAAVSTAPATCSGSATFTAPVYTATAAVTAGAATASGSATFSAGTKTASAAVTTGSATASGSATFAAGTKTASAAVSTAPATCSGSATFAAGTKTAAAAVTTGTATASGSATFTAPVYIASAAVSTAPATCSGSAQFATVIRTASGSVSTGATTASGSATFTAPVYTASSAVSSAPVTASGSATFTAPAFTATIAVQIAAVTCTGTATFTVAGVPETPTRNPRRSVRRHKFPDTLHRPRFGKIPWFKR